MQEQRLTYLDRSNYTSGPWDNEPDRIYWVDEETQYPCLMRRNASGVWCGYVAVNESHPFYGKSYSRYEYVGQDFKDSGLDIDIHGGLTFAGHCDGDTEKGICHAKADGENDEVYWFGFDCHHSQDFSPHRHFSGWGGTYRDEAYVKDEVKSLAKQLKNLEGKS